MTAKPRKKPAPRKAKPKAPPKAPDAPPVEQPAPDPFDPERLRIDSASQPMTERVLVACPVSKPSRTAFFRVHPDSSYRLDTWAIIDEQGETSIIAPEMQAAASLDSRPIRLVTCVTWSGAVFLWPIKLPGSDGRSNAWTDSALRICQEATQRWVRMIADMSAGHYTCVAASNNDVAPRFPDISFRDLLRIAFADRLIDDFDHPLLKMLRGEG